jgi:hypothetical protein
MAAAAPRLLAEAERLKTELLERREALRFLQDRGDAEYRVAEQRLADQQPFIVDPAERQKRDDARYMPRVRAADERAAPLAEVSGAIAGLLSSHIADGFDAGPVLEAWKAAREALRSDPDAPLPGAR